VTLTSPDIFLESHNTIRAKLSSGTKLLPRREEVQICKGTLFNFLCRFHLFPSAFFCLSLSGKIHIVFSLSRSLGECYHVRTSGFYLPCGGASHARNVPCRVTYSDASGDICSFLLNTHLRLRFNLISKLDALDNNLNKA
jgi:hypothetical protein